MENFIFCAVDVRYFQMRPSWLQDYQSLALSPGIFLKNWTRLNSNKNPRNLMLNHIF